MSHYRIIIVVQFHRFSRPPEQICFSHTGRSIEECHVPPPVVRLLNYLRTTFRTSELASSPRVAICGRQSSLAKKSRWSLPNRIRNA